MSGAAQWAAPFPVNDAQNIIGCIKVTGCGSSLAADPDRFPAVFVGFLPVTLFGPAVGFGETRPLLSDPASFFSTISGNTSDLGDFSGDKLRGDGGTDEAVAALDRAWSTRRKRRITKTEAIATRKGRRKECQRVSRPRR